MPARARVPGAASAAAGAAAAVRAVVVPAVVERVDPVPVRPAETAAARGRAGQSNAGATQTPATTRERVVDDDSVTIDQQAEAAGTFTRGLIEAWGVDAQVDVKVEDDENVLVDVNGNDLGLLVGPKGATLRAIEELVRTVVQRQTEGHGVRIRVDVGGYQAKRRAALESFVHDLAHKVLESGRDHALEPMTPSDRKVVHDAVSDIDGVTTISEGEEPRRRVVLRRAAS